MIIVAALLAVREAYGWSLSKRTNLAAPSEGLLANILASVIYFIWCWVLITQGRRQRSKPESVTVVDVEVRRPWRRRELCDQPFSATSAIEPDCRRRRR